MGSFVIPPVSNFIGACLQTRKIRLRHLSCNQYIIIYTTTECHNSLYKETIFSADSNSCLRMFSGAMISALSLSDNSVPSQKCSFLTTVAFMMASPFGSSSVTVPFRYSITRALAGSLHFMSISVYWRESV